MSGMARASAKRVQGIRTQFQPATLKVADEMKGDIMQKIIAIIIASAFALLAGCNTVEGFGQDVKGAGRGIEKAADKAKPN
ncbi:MAG: entericidin A/B family lipoprotein [Casimicrobiaceae bacterium]